MFEIIVTIAVVLAVVIAIVLILAMTKPHTFRVERAATIRMIAIAIASTMAMMAMISNMKSSEFVN